MNRRRILSLGKAFTAVEFRPCPFHACVTAVSRLKSGHFAGDSYMSRMPIESEKIAYYTPTPRL